MYVQYTEHIINQEIDELITNRTKQQQASNNQQPPTNSRWLNIEDPLLFWKENAFKYPELSILAK